MQRVERAVEADEYLRSARFNGAGRAQGILAVQRGKHVLRPHAQGGQALLRKLDVDAFGLLTDDIDLFHARHVQQPLAQGFRLAHQQALRLALGLQRIQGKGDVGVFVIDHGTDHAGRQIGRLVAGLLARLVKLGLHLLGRRAVEQGQCGEGQAGRGVGLGPFIPAQLLQALFDLLGHLVLHFARAGAGPGGDDGHHLDRERRVFRAPQLEERQQAGQRNEADQEQGDGTFAHGQRGQVEAGRAHGRAPAPAASGTTGAVSTLTRSS
ncbi:hypothetical protein D3C72_1438380 [compost metagenome]